MSKVHSPAAKAIMEYAEPVTHVQGAPSRPLASPGSHRHHYVPKKGLLTGRLLWVCEVGQCTALVSKWEAR